MVAGSFSDRPETVRHPKGTAEGVLPVAAIYGANASGKTNVIMALRFMQAAVTDSHARWEPSDPIQIEGFVGDSSPTTLAVDFLLNKIRHQYGFSFSKQAILEEWLHAYPLGKKQTLFARKKGKPMSFSTKLQGENRTIERLTRPNSLFLSCAVQNNHEYLFPIQQWFSSSLFFALDERTNLKEIVSAIDVGSRSTELFSKLLSIADFGISDLNVKDVSWFDQPGLKEYSKQFPDLFTQMDNTGKRREFRFTHRIDNSSVSFNQQQESKGTIAFLSLLYPVLDSLRKGAVICIDELDNSLHPLLAISLIGLFNHPKGNDQGAQLIFNTHDTNLLSAGVLRRDQIWFTEKKPDGESQLYPLTDFKPRKEENLENGYLQGRYGAIPFLNSDSFLLPSSDGHGKK